MARARDPAKGGAKGKYLEWLTDEGLLKIQGWAMDGLTDEQIAQNIGISRSTLSEWKKRYSDISDALKKGKEVIDRQVENALLKRALGYRYEEVTREMVEDGTGRLEVTKVVTKEVQPDVTAQIFWLKNRKPDAWRDTQLTKAQIEKLQVDAELARLRAELIKGVKKDTGMLETLLEAQKQFEKLMAQGAFAEFEGDKS